MSKIIPSLPKGIRDFNSEVSAKRNYIVEKIKYNFIKYGFGQLETPAIENLSVLTDKYGEEGEHLLYKILDSGDYLNKTTLKDYEQGSKSLSKKITKKGLRYDLTVPFARYVAMNYNKLAFPYKRYQIQPVWRGDNPQKGRYREFYQCDADIVGSENLWNEVELILLIHDVFSDLSLDEYVIKINHRTILSALAKYVGLKEKTIAFCVEIDKLEKIGNEKVMNNILALGGNKEKTMKVMDIFLHKDQNTLMDNIQNLDPNNLGIEKILTVLRMLDNFKKKNIKVLVDISLARGLSYYTGMIFEVKPTSVKIGSICGGGRYDNLAGTFGLDGISGIGISFGLDRIYDVLEELNRFPKDSITQIDILIVHFDEENFIHGQKIVTQLRSNNIKSDIYPQTDKIKKQLAYANKIGVKYVLFVGDNEIKSEKYLIKNMKTGEQNSISLRDVVLLFSEK